MLTLTVHVSKWSYITEHWLILLDLYGLTCVETPFHVRSHDMVSVITRIFAEPRLGKNGNFYINIYVIKKTNEIYHNGD